MFVDSFFVEFSPIQLPYDSLPERSKFFLDEDLSFFILFILHSLIIFFRVLKEVRKEKEVKKKLSFFGLFGTKDLVFGNPVFRSHRMGRNPIS